MNAKELRAAAEHFKNRSYEESNEGYDEFCKDRDAILTHGVDHILATVHADDDEPVTVDDCDELGLGNSSTSPYQRRYELAPGIRIIAQACPGGFNLCELWIGGGSDFRQFKSIRKGQFRHLLAGLGMGGGK